MDEPQRMNATFLRKVNSIGISPAVTIPAPLAHAFNLAKGSYILHVPVWPAGILIIPMELLNAHATLDTINSVKADLAAKRQPKRRGRPRKDRGAGTQSFDFGTASERGVAEVG